MNRYIYKLLVLISLITLLLSGICFAYYPLPAKYPKVGNFGDFRSSVYLHDGLDMACGLNTPVSAVDSGTVIEVDRTGVTDYGRSSAAEPRLADSGDCP